MGEEDILELFKTFDLEGEPIVPPEGIKQESEGLLSLLSRPLKRRKKQSSPLTAKSTTVENLLLSYRPATESEPAKERLGSALSTEKSKKSPSTVTWGSTMLLGPLPGNSPEEEGMQTILTAKNVDQEGESADVIGTTRNK